tara:strand:- start:27304 stop:27507 length:204 start_codon:yes stop_codon:yes gene_type:complete
MILYTMSYKSENNSNFLISNASLNYVMMYKAQFIGERETEVDRTKDREIYTFGGDKLIITPPLPKTE